MRHANGARGWHFAGPDDGEIGHSILPEAGEGLLTDPRVSEAAADIATDTVVVNFRSRRQPSAPLRPQAEPATVFVDPLRALPDPSLIDIYSAADCLRDDILPWRTVQGQTIILSESTPDAQRMARLRATFGPLRLARCVPGATGRAIRAMFGPQLANEAETLCPPMHSCRSWNFNRARWAGLMIILGLALLTWFLPVVVVGSLVIWACVTLVLNTGLKIAAAVVHLRQPMREVPLPVPVRLPVITVMVPLYKEREIASHLLVRLSRLDYPPELLDVLLILEDDDHLTAETLSHCDFPSWARLVEVPEGTLRTKPRALNFALSQARGSIIGIYDAEDQPDPDQLRKVAGHFAAAQPDVACLQGVLDYYNADSNWLSRCFTLEYASWFRIILPGLARLGLVVPLGGTTLFLRREAIEGVGGWDAHNVTEDADLGLRLARAGYRTQLISTITQEEANARAWPWVKQRTRWLKGYAMTWAVHMARPRVLWRDLGAWRFFGMQVLFLGTLSQFLLAPVLWSFWLLFFGLPHPLSGVLSGGAVLAISLLFLTAEAATLTVAALAARHAGKPRLGFWGPALQVYFPLATIAAWRAIYEVCAKPFYWDKTVHGIFAPGAEIDPGKTAGPAMPPASHRRATAINTA